MNPSLELIGKVEKYATNLLTFHLPETILYHNLEHTRSVVEGCRIISKQLKLPRDQAMIIELAAWFNDTGFLSQPNAHEELSVKIATNFLKTKKIHSGVIRQVSECILTTKENVEPEGVNEAIIHDARLFGLKRSDYWDRNGNLRKEMSILNDKEYDHYEWYLMNLEVLKKISFKTSFGKTLLDNKRQWRVLENEHLLHNLQNKRMLKNMPSLFPSQGYINTCRY